MTIATSNRTSAAGRRWQGSLLTGLLFLAIGAAAVYGFLRLFPPQAYQPPTEALRGYDSTPMRQAMAAETVQAELATILGYGDRMVGKPGHAATAAHIRAAYEAAGLDIQEQQVRVPVPVTRRRDLLLADGQPADFAIYPFFPNHVQPIHTPPAGIRGELTLVTDELILTGRDFEGRIAVIDASQPRPKGYDYNWPRYARLGFAAVIVTHAKGLATFDWAEPAAMVSVGPVNFPRLIAEPAILDHLGEPVTLHVEVRWENLPTRTIVGRLRAGNAGEAANEAIVVPVSYDALSILPDLAPGAFQAVSVATHLQVLRGMLPYREQLRRDVVFIAFGARYLAHTAQNELLRAIGRHSDRVGRRNYLEAKLAENQHIQQQVATLVACFDEPAFVTELAATAKVLDGLDEPTRERFHDAYQYVLNSLVFELSETMLQAKIVFEAGNTSNLDSPEFAAYRAAKDAYDAAFSAAGYPVTKLLDRKAEFAASVGVRDQVLARLRELDAFHREQAASFAEGLALNTMLRGYRQLIVLAPELAPEEVKAPAPKAVPVETDVVEVEAAPVEAAATDIVEPAPEAAPPAEVRLHVYPGARRASAGTAAAPKKESITFSMGNDVDASEHAQPIKDLLQGAIANLGLDKEAAVWTFDKLKQHDEQVHPKVGGMQMEARLWSKAQYPAYSIVSVNRPYRSHAFPVVLPWMRDLSSLRISLPVVGESILSAAFGAGTFNPLKQGQTVFDFYGNVYVSNVGQSIIPNYPLKDALIGCKPGGNQGPANGYYPLLMLFSDPYGHYDLTTCFAAFAPSMWSFSPVAFGFDRLGDIYLVKDEGASAQRIFKSLDLRAAEVSSAINIVCFRGTSVTLLDLINPQSLKAYAGVELIQRKGLSAFPSSYTMRVGGDLHTAFVRPDEYFYVRLKAGSVDNEKVQDTRAFMLGVSPEQVAAARANQLSTVRMGSEIQGPGYLSARQRFIRDVPREVALSMIFVNDQRLDVQQYHHMADPQTADFQDNAYDLLTQSLADTMARRDQILRSREAVTYATLNHPVLRRNISDAVWGIIYYLGLLVPFVFFFEKLIFGFTDIRKQLAVHGVTFLVVFLLLRLLHPAFAMIRSSLMILLGFVILLIATGIIAMFSSKFRENLEEIRKRRGQVSEAEVNKFGATAIAFMLGLNNMHRRRVRTLLTCGTLILITFVMICFTSVQSDLVEEALAVGKAPYQGFLVQNEDYIPIDGTEVAALQDKYGADYRVVSRGYYMGEERWDTKERFYPKIEIARTVTDKQEHEAAVSRVLLADPATIGQRLTISGAGFRTAPAAANAPVEVLIAAPLAKALELKEGDLPMPGLVAGDRELTIVGIFESAQALALTTGQEPPLLAAWEGDAAADPGYERAIVIPISGGDLVKLPGDDPTAVADRVTIAFTRTIENRPSANPHTLLRLSHDEPLAPHLKLEAGHWFTEEQVTDTSRPVPLLVSEEIARALGISIAMVRDAVASEAGGIEVKIGNHTVLLQGIFKGAALDGLIGLNGRNLLPFDIQALREINKIGEFTYIADEDSPQLSGEAVAIVPRDPGFTFSYGHYQVDSVAVVLKGLGYSDAKDIIDRHMEQSGRSTYYGLAGYAFSGKRAREASLVGLLDMLVPLIIAAFTVLNTIRGSVFERRDEIFVYNAVGIAPGHIFFIFFAEAIVYAVVGSVLGYILSQGTGKVLTMANLTGGLTMSFTSLSTIYASLTIMAAVFLSTIFPARSAKRIAAPSDDVGWRLPEPEADVLHFNLPFTFNQNDRIGVLAFFRRFFVDHGEGSSGAFYAGKPEMGVTPASGEQAGSYIPQLSTMVWLKPFDLGVSQRLIISLPVDPETGEFVAHVQLIRQSGTLDNWQRLNRKFITLIRRQFLHWRAVKTEERQLMFTEARNELTATVQQRGVTPAATSANATD